MHSPTAPTLIRASVRHKPAIGFIAARLVKRLAAAILVCGLAGALDGCQALVPWIEGSTPGGATGPGVPGIDGTIPVERAVVEIPLAGPLAEDEAEISGLGWYSGTLILLPQFPKVMASRGEGAIFGLPRSQLEAFLQGQIPGPLQPVEIPISSGGIEDQISGYEGFEAIGFHGNQVFLTIETHRGLRMVGYLISGQIDPELKALRLDPASLTENSLQAQQFNHSDEALLVDGDRILTFYESNGVKQNPNAHATVFDLQFKRLSLLPFPPLEYRLTDAAGPDSQGRFWVINHYFTSDFDLKPVVDPLAAQYGKGPTQAHSELVERLVEYQITSTGIVRTDTPPVPLQLSPDGAARNWEGLAILPGQGFLLATDKFPATILGFVAYP